MENEKEFKDTLVFYHGGCPDGFGAAYSAWKKFGDKATYIPLSYAGYDIPGVEGKEIYFLDLTPQKDTLAELMKKNEVMSIDHHESARDDVEVLKNKIFDTTRSAAYLTWQHFHASEKIPTLIEHISDYDLYEFKLSGTQELNLYMKTIPLEFNAWDTTMHDLEVEQNKQAMINVGKSLTTYRDGLAKKIIEATIRKVLFEGYEVYAVNCASIPDLVDPMGNHLSTEHPPFAIIWSRARNTIKISLRGNGDVDVSKLAEKFPGGGGHPESAGFNIPDNSELPWKEIE
jgi:uncharacterized protein